MRFLFLSYSYEKGLRGDAGGFRKPWELAWALQRLGHSVCVLYPRLAGQCPVRDVPCRSYPVWDAPLARPLTAYLGQLAASRGLDRKERPDVVYFRTGMNVLPLLLRPMLGARVILEANADPVQFLEAEGRARASAWLFKITERINARGSDLIVALTPGLKRTLESRHALPDGKVVVIPSATDPEHFTPGDAHDARKRLGLDPRRPTLGFVGLFYQHQGVHTLLKAVAQLRSAIPNVLCLVVGDGVMRRPWQALAARLGIAEAVQFPGQVPYPLVPTYLNAMDVVVAPFTAHRGEASPFKVLDAMACARPVAASAIPSIEVLAQEAGGALVLVPPEDPGALAETLQTLLASPETRRTSGAAGRAHVTQRHSWDVIARRLLHALGVK